MIQEEKKVKIKTIVISALVAIVAYVLLIAILTYVFGIKNKLVEVSTKVIPYPVSLVGFSDFISLGELWDNTNSVKRFYETQDFSQVGMRVDFSGEDGGKRLKLKEKQILNKMIEDETIIYLAKKMNIRITEQDLNDTLKRKMDEFGSVDTTKEKLAKLYGWNIDDFAEKVVKPSLYYDELKKIFEKKEADNFQKLKEKMEMAKKELDSGVDFSQVTVKYSEKETAQKEGELGWFKKEQIIPDVAKVVFSLNIGDRSDIIESELGYHVVEIEDKNGDDQIKMRQIFIRKKSFADWLDSERSNIGVHVFVRGYRWNEELSKVEFTDNNMVEFEKKSIENILNDPTVNF